MKSLISLVVVLSMVCPVIFATQGATARHRQLKSLVLENPKMTVSLQANTLFPPFQADDDDDDDSGIGEDEVG